MTPPMTMTPLACYESDLQQGNILLDPAQRIAAQKLQSLYDDLIAHALTPNKRWFMKLTLRANRVRRRSIKGIYLWGGVGLGKTYLMDKFYDCLPTQHKKRIHFHRFMQWIHEQLKTLQGRANPLKYVAQRLAEKSRIVCLDELYVSEIGDAMILARLLEAMFHNDITLVITSNLPPHDLYKDGLQRVRFLPAIELLNRHTRVFELRGKMDYRLRYLDEADIYHTPIDSTTDALLLKHFLRLAPGEMSENDSLEIHGRTISSIRLTDGIAWFEFNALCKGPRSQADYIEIAQCFNTVLISNIPVMGQDNDITRRFISLIDVFYDRNINLIASAAAPPSGLYTGQRLAFEFQRTQSRLTEMRTHDYLARQHCC